MTVEGLNEIYSMMKNIYMGWQAVLMTQMTVQQQQFFSMLFRTREYKIKNSQKVPRINTDALIFKPKPQSVIIKKINLEHKTYSFFKQSLRMITYSISMMLPSFQVSKLDKLIKAVKKGEQIMNLFEQHLFSLQKLQFYFLKCRIHEFISKQMGMCLKFDFKYEFPLGLFDLIYKNLRKWKQNKLLHYVNLLMKVLFLSMKNELLSIRQAYILGQQVKLLVKIVKKKDTLIGQNIQKESKNKKSLRQKQLINHNFHGQSNELSNKNYQQRQIDFNNMNMPNNRKKKSFQQSQYSVEEDQKFRRKKQQKQNGKISLVSILKVILVEINNYLTEKKQLFYLVSSYMLEDYHKYKSFGQNEELIDQIPTLIDQKYSKKSYKKKIIQKSKLNQQQSLPNQSNQPFEHNNKISLSQKLNPKQAKSQNINSAQEDTNTQNYDNNLFEEKKQKQFNKKKQFDFQKGKQIIVRNIMNVKINKLQKKLKLDRKNKEKSQLIDTKRTAVTTTSSTFSSNQSERKQKSRLMKSLLEFSVGCEQLPSLSSSIGHHLEFLQQNSSDSENELSLQFERQRRQEISAINSKYYKATNINYLISGNETKSSSENNNNNNNNSMMESKQFTGAMENESIVNSELQKSQYNQEGLKAIINKASEEIQFEQIKMLDEVIKQKVLTLLDVQIDSIQMNHNQKKKKTSSSTMKSQHEAILNYTTAKKLTDKLLKQVELLNHQQKILTQKLKSKINPQNNANSLNSLEYIHKIQPFSQFQKINQKILSQSENFIKDFEQVYSLKGNLQLKAQHYENLYRKLLHIKPPNTKINSNKFTKVIQKYADIHKMYNNQRNLNDLSIIGETQQEAQNTYRFTSDQQQLNIDEYIVHNRPLSQIEQYVKGKQQQLKFNQIQGEQDSLNVNEKKQIALRQLFDNLRVDVGRNRFNQTHFLDGKNHKTLGLKIYNEDKQ